VWVRRGGGRRRRCLRVKRTCVSRLFTTKGIPLSNTNQESTGQPASLVRGLGVLQATALNVANMVGIGPFITIPIFIRSMHGPHALVAWVVAALLVLCDGLVWSELGAALPGSGGTYHFLREIFGRSKWGRVLPFLFIWQFLITGTLEMASGYIGSMDYVEYIFPQLKGALADVGGTGWIAAAASIVVTLLLCRRIDVIGWLGVMLCTGTLITVGIVIVSGLRHFDGAKLAFPEGAFEMNAAFAVGLAGAMRIAIYDYLGYYNICHLGEEVRDPGRTIPRAVIYSVCLVAAIYLTMNVSIIAVVPWQEAMQSQNIAADFMEKLFGRPVAIGFTCLVLWTSGACMFAITLGYSRIPFAAARNGDFFAPFARLHSRDSYPVWSLLAVGGLTAIFCFFPLQLVINSAVTIRIAVQFIAQILGLHVVRKTRPDIHLPFRMWLYPLPSLIALTGWLFVLFTKDSDFGYQPLLLAVAVNASGALVYWVWKGRRGDSAA
jgi:amino acid transporter